MIYVFEKRVSPRTLEWEVADSDADHSQSRGEQLDGVTLTDVNPRRACEILDYQGHSDQPLCSAAFVETVRGVAPNALTATPAQVVNRPAIERDLFLCHLRVPTYGRDILDLDRTQVYLLEGELISCIRLAITASATQKLCDSAAFFTIDGFDGHLLLTEPLAAAMDGAGLTGFKLFALDAWYDGIDSDDPYLTPSYHPDADNERPHSIRDPVGHPDQRTPWVPDGMGQYETSWPATT